MPRRANSIPTRIEGYIRQYGLTDRDAIQADLGIGVRRSVTNAITRLRQDGVPIADLPRCHRSSLYFLEEEGARTGCLLGRTDALRRLGVEEDLLHPHLIRERLRLMVALGVIQEGSERAQALGLIVDRACTSAEISRALGGLQRSQHQAAFSATTLFKFKGDDLAAKLDLFGLAIEEEAIAADAYASHFTFRLTFTVPDDRHSPAYWSSKIARAYAQKHPELPEEGFLSAGKRGFTQAVERFEPNRGAPFLDYARYHVERAVRGYAQTEGKNPSSIKPFLPTVKRDHFDHRLLSPDEESALVKQYKASPEGSYESWKARDTLILCNMKRVRMFAQKHSDSGIPMQDLVQVGVEGLIRAIDEFDPEGSTSFLTQIKIGIRVSIRMHIENHGRNIRAPSYTVALVSHYNELLREFYIKHERPPYGPEELAQFSGMPLDTIAEWQGLKMMTSNTSTISDSLPIGPDGKRVLGDLLRADHDTAGGGGLMERDTLAFLDRVKTAYVNAPHSNRATRERHWAYFERYVWLCTFGTYAHEDIILSICRDMDVKRSTLQSRIFKIRKFINSKPSLRTMGRSLTGYGKKSNAETSARR